MVESGESGKEKEERELCMPSKCNRKFAKTFHSAKSFLKECLYFRFAVLPFFNLFMKICFGLFDEKPKT